jgi:hypothetical protein
VVGGSTKGLHTHLSSKHNIDLLCKKSATDVSYDVNVETLQPLQKKMKITSYFVEKQDTSLAAVLSSMT